MFPPLVIQAVKLARRFKKLQDEDEGWEKKCSTLFRFIHQVISILHSKVDNSDIVLRLFLLAGQSADECGFEDICYEFFVQACWKMLFLVDYHIAGVGLLAVPTDHLSLSPSFV